MKSSASSSPSSPLSMISHFGSWPPLSRPPRSTFTFHSTLSCYYCLTNLIILPLLCHAFSPSLLSSVCPSNLLGLAQSLSSASLLTVQPFDFLNRLCSHPGTFSSLILFSAQMHKHWNIIQSHFSFLSFFFIISSCVMHAALMNMGRGFPPFKPSALTPDSVIVQQGAIVTAKI